MPFPVLILASVFALIAIRQVGSVRLEIWQIMTGGAVAVLAAGSISPGDALASIDADVMFFLFGMFVVGRALEASGYLSHLSYHYFRRSTTRNGLLLLILFGAGFASAFLMNDTLAIIGTPVVLLLAKKHEMRPTMLLLALCIAVTTGSVLSPIGNPQNLLIALHGGIVDPFVTFFQWLFVPTVLNLLLAFWMLRRYYPDDFHAAELKHSQEPIHDHHLALLSRLSLQMIVALVAIKVLGVAFGWSFELPLTVIALASALPVLLGTRQRWQILRRIDWPTLAFFAAMFMLMESVWETGFFQDLMRRWDVRLVAVESVLSVSVLLSQAISNVPLVALVQPLLLSAGGGERELMALAAGSTIAGNVFILGAASNIIVIQNAERRSHATVTFWEFAKIGVPLTIAQTAVYWGWMGLW
ncbi:MAG: SLC13 family permease [Bacteroidetes bacterium]|jgi:Na+/H+ antiporter NhaD/arsenite permease-like protein|nr:SLC13 family permease [Bacteroidota bacterium]